MHDHPHEHIWNGVCVLLLIVLSMAVAFGFRQFQRAEELQGQVDVLDAQVNELVRENQRLENSDPFVRYRNQANARMQSLWQRAAELREQTEEQSPESQDDNNRREQPHSIEESSLVIAS